MIEAQQNFIYILLSFLSRYPLPEGINSAENYLNKHISGFKKSIYMYGVRGSIILCSSSALVLLQLISCDRSTTNRCCCFVFFQYID